MSLRKTGGRVVLLFVACWLATAATPVAAENDGVDDLDKAFQLKLVSDDPTELHRIIELCEASLRKGLDDDNTKLCHQLLSTVLLDRAELISRVIFRGVPNGPAAMAQIVKLRLVALRDLEKATTINDALPRAEFLIARLHMLPGGDPLRAVKALDATLKSDADDKLKSEAYGLRGDVHADPKKRLADYSKSIELNPRFVEAIRSRAQLLAQMEQFDESLADLDKALEITPEHADTYRAKGMVLATQGKLEEAAVALNKAIELDPGAGASFLQRARLHALNGDQQKAIEDLDEALELQPGNPLARLLRAECQMSLGKVKEATEDVDYTIRQYPDLAPARRAKAVILASEGKFARAVEELERVKRAQPEDQQTRLQLAALYRAQMDVEKALSTYDEAIEIEPEHSGALRSRADTYVWVGRHQEAVSDYEQALKTEPENRSALNNLSWLLCTSPDDKLRDGPRAVELALEACRLGDYQEAYILSTLAAAYAETGKFDLAKKWANKAVELSDDKEQRQHLAKELKSYNQSKPWRERQTGPDPSARTATKPAPRPE